MLLKILLYLFIFVFILILSFIISSKLSPWPNALLMRHEFVKEAERVNNELNKHVPEGISSILNLQYDTSDEDAFLDIYYPANIESTEITLPVIVWMHGGGWISGNKEQVSNYCKILAGKGYVVVSVNYSIAPEEKYPTPVRQLMSTLDFLKSNAQLYHINISNFILAGDSGGAQISAQAANIIVSPSYSELMKIKPALSPAQLTGLILYCGPYDIKNVSTEGEFGSFLKTVLWSYSGVKDFMNDTNFAPASVLEYVTKDFPPVFISAGNGDPLESQSKNLAQKLETLGVLTDTLFFPEDHTPPLPHEYQFNLDTDAGKLALDRSVKFLISVSPPEFAEPEKINNLTLNIQ